MTPADALDPVGRLTRILDSEQKAGALERMPLCDDEGAHYMYVAPGVPGHEYATLADLRAVLRRLEDSEAKLARIANAWHVVGPRPVVHRRAQRDLMSNWPTLAEAIVVAIPALPAAPRPDAGGAG